MTAVVTGTAADTVGTIFPIPYRVVGRRRDTHDVVTLRIRPVDGDLPDFRPAQFSMIGVVGIGDVPVSISSPTTQLTGHDYTIRAAGAVTQALHRMDDGDVVSIRGPFGNSWDLSDVAGRHVLFVAGGIGIAPLRAAVHEAIDRPDVARVTVLVGAVSPPNLVYADWLQDLQDQGAAVHTTVDRTDGNEWTGRVGLVTSLIPDVVDDPLDTVAFVCGPDAMMRATGTVLHQAGVPADRIQLTLERNMHCGFGRCGHCQLGRLLICRDGPVVQLDDLGPALLIREL